MIASAKEHKRLRLEAGSKKVKTSSPKLNQRTYEELPPRKELAAIMQRFDGYAADASAHA
jgi:hypothetical protein